MLPFRYVVADCETSGLFDYKQPADADGQPRMAQLALVHLDDALNVQHTESFLIRPDGWVMDDAGEACAVHGLTHGRLMTEGVPIVEALTAYNAVLNSGRVIVGYNVPFDLKMMRAEMRRAGLPDRYETTASVDCMHPTAHAMKAKNGGKYKTAKLVLAYEALFGKRFDGVHGALEDALACAEIFRYLVANKHLSDEKLSGVKAI